MEESGGQGRIRLNNACSSSNRLPWLWPYPWRQSATNLIFCVPGPSKCRRLGVCFPCEHSRLQSPLHMVALLCVGALLWLQVDPTRELFPEVRSAEPVAVS